MADPLLEIHDLHAAIADREILTGIDLVVRAGEVHAIMGPNGSGKSTLTRVLAGHPDYTVTNGRISFRGEDLSQLGVEARSTAGLFIGFQYPVEVPGVRNAEFLRLAYNARQRARGRLELSAADFAPFLRRCLEAVEMDADFAERGVNAGFSGGQKKRNEILQLFVLQPELAVLDETDSGLDIDALRTVARGINAYRSPQRAIVLITHYPRLLELVVPDQVHVLVGGRIVRSGGKDLAHELDQRGYDGFAP
jgi:Fe-S cluster assembly ATP-binding protein